MPYIKKEERENLEELLQTMYKKISYTDLIKEHTKGIIQNKNNSNFNDIIKE